MSSFLQKLKRKGVHSGEEQQPSSQSPQTVEPAREGAERLVPFCGEGSVFVEVLLHLRLGIATSGD